MLYFPWVAIAWKCEYVRQRVISYLDFSNFILSNLDVCHVVKIPKALLGKEKNRKARLEITEL